MKHIKIFEEYELISIFSNLTKAFNEMIDDVIINNKLTSYHNRHNDEKRIRQAMQELKNKIVKFLDTYEPDPKSSIE